VNSSLIKFFEPASLVVVGASAILHKPGNDVIRNILANNYQGRIYLVNPKGGEILGIKTNCSIKELPEGIDLGIIILPARENIRVVEECIQKGIKHFILAAGGFSEVDGEGSVIEGQLRELVSSKGIRIIGPNTSGVTSTPANFTSSFFPLGRIPRGNVSFVSQTGNFATHTMRYIITGEHFGVTRVIGLGNKLDVDESEALEFLGDDPETKSIMMYLESIKRPRMFLEIARKVTKHKPVVMLKGGTTTRGKDAALAHTASLASDDRIIDGALKQAGITRVFEYSHLIWAAKAFSFMPLPHGNRVSVLAPSGAMLVVLTDLCEQRLGLEVPEVEEQTRERLQEISPAYIRMRNPVDIWPAAATKGVEFAYREALNAVLRDPNIDAVVPILMLTEDTGAPPLDFIVELSRKYSKKPVLVTFSGDKQYIEQGKAFLELRGIPTFPMIEDAFHTLSIMARSRASLDYRI
jgi:acyl-CoA synthetase (NDP forming)